jgi:hypothetical protein
MEKIIYGSRHQTGYLALHEIPDIKDWINEQETAVTSAGSTEADNV